MSPSTTASQQTVPRADPPSHASMLSGAVVASGCLSSLYIWNRVFSKNSADSTGPIGVDMFLWHPALMSLSVVSATPCAILAFTQRKMFGSKHRRNQVHGFFASIAATSMVLGLAAIFSHKNAKAFPHLRSPHSWLGALLVGTLPVGALVGPVVLYGLSFLPLGMWRTMRNRHAFGGWWSLVLCGMTYASGVMGTQWSQRVFSLPERLGLLLLGEISIVGSWLAVSWANKASQEALKKEE